jgi:hypothetical protein
MFKKLLGILLALVLSMSMFVGCTLVEENTEAKMAQPVAVIEPITVQLDDGTSYTTERRTISKYELNNYFVSLAEQYLSYYGVKELYDLAFDNLVNRQLLLIEVEVLKQKGLLPAEPTQKQTNDAWKEVYAQLDTLIYAQMEEIAEDYDLEAPTAPVTGTDSTPTYAVPEEDTDADDVVEAEWFPAYKAVDYTVDGSNKVLTDDHKLWLQATRDVLGDLIDLVDQQQFLLTESEKARLAEDKKAFAAIKSVQLTDDRIAGVDADASTAAPLTGGFENGEYVPVGPKADDQDVKGIYSRLKDYFCVEYAFFQNYRDSIDVENLEEYVKKDVTITDADVVNEYNRLLDSQKVSFGTAASATDTQKSNYTSALDATDGDLVVYRPYDVKQYFVKHILVPFSDEQTKLFTSTSTDIAVQDKTEEQLKAIRAGLVEQITSYKHVDGFDVKDRTYTLAQIRNDIAEYMGSAAGNATLADSRFTDLIFKWNTDPGIFNNALGYGLRYGEASSYMKEFEDTCNELYEEYLAHGEQAIGMIKECVTDYGVHFIMLSSVVGTSTLTLESATDASGKTTVREQLYDSLLNSAKEKAFTSYQQTLVNSMHHSWSDSIKEYRSRYADLVKMYEQ